jgi:formiminotetrahydrofolate cyclodeaminase
MSDRTLAAYIEAAASPEPAPGAGSVAAVAGAMGAALGEMVCGITNKSAPADAPPPLDGPASALRSCRQRLLELAPSDEAAYLAFRTAQALPKETNEQKATRRNAMQSALIVAAEVPLDIADQATTALEQIVTVAQSGSKYTLADISTAAHVLNASVLGALENVNVNIELIKDPVDAGRLSDAVSSVDARRASALERTFDEIAARQSK